MAGKTDVFDREFLSNLQRLTIATKKPFRGAMKGEKRSPKRGTAIEFADYREYVPGDDFRYIDWTLYSRLNRLYLKLFEEEEDLFVYILLDASESMAFGEPRKFECALRLAAAFAYIALSSLNRVQVSTFADRLGARFGPKRGKGSIFQLFEFLARLEPGGRSGLDRAVKEFSLTTRRTGVLILLSDFMFPGGYADALAPIVGRGFDVGCVQILDRSEIDPDLEGDLILLDSETGEEREITISPASVRRYREELSAYNEGLREWCFARQANYLLATTDTDFRALVMRYLRIQGFIE